MNIGRRPTYALLLSLVCLNILVRLPRTEHEPGVDSFFIHTLATAVTEQGRIPWVISPLGYLGWYPLSYPPAGPLMISSLQQLARLSGEGSILALSIGYGVLGVPAAFVMGRAFRRDDVFALTTAVIFSLAPRFMNFTLWSASTRNLFMVLIPIFLWSLIRNSRKPTAPDLTVLVGLLVLMLATHRLTILLGIVVLAFIAAFVFLLVHRVLRLQFPKLLLAPRYRRWIPHLALLAILGIAVFMIAKTRVLDEYTTGEICAGSDLGNELCNVGVSITRSVGLALPFALLGLVQIVRQNGKGYVEAFLVLSLLALTPTLFLRQYTGFYILPFLAVVGAFGVLKFASALRKRPRAEKALLVASVVAISGFSLGVLNIEVERTIPLLSSTYSTALYLQTLPNAHFVSNDGLLTVRVEAISGVWGIPVGGAGTTPQSPELLIMGSINASDVFERERRVPIGALTIEDDSPFFLVSLDAEQDWIDRILRSDVDSVRPELVHRYGLGYFLEDDSHRGEFIAFSKVYSQPEFSTSVHMKRYKIFDGTNEDLFLAFPS